MGPVKNSHKAKTYLEHKSLISVDNNYNTETLANFHITTSFDPKIPDQATYIMRAVVLLMMGNLHNLAVDKITAIVTEKMQTMSTQLLKQIEHEFLTAASSDQAKHAQLLHDIASSYRNSLLHLEISPSNIENTVSKLHSSTQTLAPTSAHTEPITSLMEITGTITKSVNHCSHLPIIPSH